MMLLAFLMKLTAISQVHFTPLKRPCHPRHAHWCTPPWTLPASHICPAVFWPPPCPFVEKAGGACQETVEAKPLRFFFSNFKGQVSAATITGTLLSLFLSLAVSSKLNLK